MRLTQNPRSEFARDALEEDEIIYIRSSIEDPLEMKNRGFVYTHPLPPTNRSYDINNVQNKFILQNIVIMIVVKIIVTMIIRRTEGRRACQIPSIQAS